jgi:SAM-dependent methyltransferase
MLPPGLPPFDAITFSHVIEHLPNPLDSLQRSLRLLKPGGRLVVVTPNGQSLGARYFGPDWVAWDPPRHLHVFTPRSLRRLLLGSGFRIGREWTTGRSARWVWKASTDIRCTGRCANVAHPRGTTTARLAGHLARCIEARYGGVGALGEELVAIAIRQADAGNCEADAAAA